MVGCHTAVANGINGAHTFVGLKLKTLFGDHPLMGSALLWIFKALNKRYERWRISPFGLKKALNYLMEMKGGEVFWLPKQINFL